MKALIDTCVVLDALQDRAGFAQNAKRIFLLAAANQFTGCITAKAVTDIYYLTHRCLHDRQASLTVLNKLFVLFEVLDTAGADCRRALLSDVSDYEDAVMIETAIRTKMDCIVTRNEKDYQKSLCPVYSPEAFLKSISDSAEDDPA